MSFRKSVKLVSEQKEYDPVFILNKMRKNKLDHRVFKPTLYKETQEMLQDLLPQFENPTEE